MVNRKPREDTANVISLRVGLDTKKALKQLAKVAKLPVATYCKQILIRHAEPQTLVVKNGK